MKKSKNVQEQKRENGQAKISHKKDTGLHISFESK